MKRLILAVTMAVVTLCATAQNGGQYNQNNAVRLTFMGLISGDYYMKVTNRLLVASAFKYDYNGNVSTFSLGALKDTLINMGKSINGVIKVKNTSPFPFVDNGWVELCLAVTPLRFVSSTATYDKVKDEVLVTFTVADVSNIDRIVVELSIDGGRTYRQLGLVWPENLQGNKTYNVRISAATIRAIK
jgi:hypothetical protein